MKLRVVGLALLMILLWLSLDILSASAQEDGSPASCPTGTVFCATCGVCISNTQTCNDSASSCEVQTVASEVLMCETDCFYGISNCGEVGRQPQAGVCQSGGLSCGLQGVERACHSQTLTGLSGRVFLVGYQVAPEGEWVVVESGPLNIRSGLGLDHPVVAQSLAGSYFVYLATDPDEEWYQVEWGEDSDTGWVSAASQHSRRGSGADLVST